MVPVSCQKKIRVGRQGNYFILLKHFTKKIMSQSEKVPIFRYFTSNSRLMCKSRVEKNRVGRETGTTYIFHLGLTNVSAQNDGNNLDRP